VQARAKKQEPLCRVRARLSRLHAPLLAVGR
jgi:hypothetical protein